MRLNIPVVLGASRPGRQSEKVARYIHKVLKNIPDVETPFVDVRDFPIEYDEDKSLPAFHSIVDSADAFVLVFPEYNHGFPGKLKSLLDTEFSAYKHKPVALASVSSGQFGGVRGLELLTPVLVNFKMIVTGLNIHVPYVQDVFDASGNPVDMKLVERILKILSELITFTTVIKVGKDQIGRNTA